MLFLSVARRLVAAYLLSLPASLRKRQKPGQMTGIPIAFVYSGNLPLNNNTKQARTSLFFFADNYHKTKEVACHLFSFYFLVTVTDLITG